MRYQDWVESLSLNDFTAFKERLKDDSINKLLHAGIGLSGEAGELVDTIKKHLFYGKELDKENLKEELGDIMFFVAMACNSLGVTMEEVLSMNVKKLTIRYNQGVFTEQQAQERLDKQTS